SRPRRRFFVDLRSSDSFYFLIETHSLPNAHSLLSSQLYLLCCSSRSLHSYSYFVHGIRSRILSVNDPLQRSRLKFQFALCLGIRHASHLSPVVNRIRTTILFQSIPI